MFEYDCCPGCWAQGTLTFRSQPRYGGGGRFPQRAQVVCTAPGCRWRGSTLDVRNNNVDVPVKRKRPGRQAGDTADRGAGEA